MEARWRRPIEDTEIARLAHDIDRQGYGVLADYVSAAELEPVRDFAVAAVEASGGEATCFVGPDALAGTLLSEMPRSPAFRSLCQRLYEVGMKRTAPDVPFYQLFRCLQGITGQKDSYRFHYDSHVLTALLPVAMPTTGRRGDLLIIPGSRSVRRRYLFNAADKLLVGNVLAQKALRLAARRKSSRIVALRMQPRHLYFFWGYRSIHTNEPCDPDKLRATALFHYGDPHEDSRSRTLITRMRGYAARLRR